MYDKVSITGGGGYVAGVDAHLLHLTGSLLRLAHELDRRRQRIHQICHNQRTQHDHLQQYPPVAPPGFRNRGEVRYGSIGGLEYEVPQSRLYCLCINVALCSTALQCICRV